MIMLLNRNRPAVRMACWQSEMCHQVPAVSDQRQLSATRWTTWPARWRRRSARRAASNRPTTRWLPGCPSWLWQSSPSRQSPCVGGHVDRARGLTTPPSFRRRRLLRPRPPSTPSNAVAPHPRTWRYRRLPSWRFVIARWMFATIAEAAPASWLGVFCCDRVCWLMFFSLVFLFLYKVSFVSSNFRTSGSSVTRQQRLWRQKSCDVDVSPFGQRQTVSGFQKVKTIPLQQAVLSLSVVLNRRSGIAGAGLGVYLAQNTYVSPTDTVVLNLSFCCLLMINDVRRFSVLPISIELCENSKYIVI